MTKPAAQARKPLRVLSPRWAHALWAQAANATPERWEKGRRGSIDFVCYGEVTGVPATTVTARAACYACGEKLPAGVEALKLEERIGAGFGQYNQRWMHMAPCVPAPAAK